MEVQEYRCDRVAMVNTTGGNLCDSYSDAWHQLLRSSPSTLGVKLSEDVIAVNIDCQAPVYSFIHVYIRIAHE